MAGMWPKVPESPGDVLTSREDLLSAAHGAIGSMQAVSGFLRDRDDLSREYIAAVLEDTWRKLCEVADATPTIYGPNGRPS
jgi:hypothetical protein